MICYIRFLIISDAGGASADVPGGGDADEITNSLKNIVVNDSNNDSSAVKANESNNVKNIADGEEPKKKKKKNKSKNQKPGVLTQTDPPTIPISELFPSGE